MKKRLIAFFLVFALIGGSFTALAAGGSADDPLISLSYLKNTAKPQLVQALLSSLYTTSSGSKTAAGQVVMDQARYKQSDTITASTGAEIVVLAGNVTVSFSGGAVVNATAGTTIASGAALAVNTRYIVGEDTTATFTITSPTAVVSCNGAATAQSSTTPDYNAMADALTALTLLRGTGTGFGSGYDLEKKPTRIEAIVMFIRLLGEEDEALACTAAHPFTDVASWADRYVAYAYQKGYSNGAGGNKFASTREITAAEYVEFVMRALQYSSIDHTDLSTTLGDAKNVGLLSAKEYNLLTTTTLLRAHVVYISYYALSTPVAGESTTLEAQLVAKGVFTNSALNSAHMLVTTARL